MVYEVAENFVYIPKWNGNRNKPENEQIKAYMRYASGALQNSMYYKYNITQDDIKNTSENYFTYDFCLICEKFSNNFKMKTKDGKERQVKPEDVAKYSVFEGLYSELKIEYSKRTSVDQLK